jgi:(1->4)-alpha-D-glucan 1-alpha-D-glucosylmutase
VLRGDLEGRAAAALLLRFQQVTGPVMAKAIEDTAFYSFSRLVSLNEVGGDPSRFGVEAGELHEILGARQRDWPSAMSASSTHDTKRSEDVRARISLLSEIPDDFARVARRWAQANERHRTTLGDGTAWPDRNLEWLLYQTLVGAWPLSVERLVAYAEKATREAKVHTSWTDPNPAYDDAVRCFIEGVLADDGFVASLEAFVAPLVAPGQVNALAAQLVKLTAPGVPDLYQGSEVWDLSLVDPDNRRPVDFTARAAMLAQLDHAPLEDINSGADDGLPKLHVTRVGLDVRRRHPAAFGPDPAGRYEALQPAGEATGHVVAFIRGGQVATVVPRLVVGLDRRGGWGDTTVELPLGLWRNELTDEASAGGAVSLRVLLGKFPVALLTHQGR